MSAVLATLETYAPVERKRLTNVAFAVRNRIGEFFGCKHREMSRPFSRQGESYRVCIGCGARRRFDANTWKPSGRYYYKPARTSDLQETNTSALRCI